nr:hypothetical protein [Candidatus Levybacteria bacterium]
MRYIKILGLNHNVHFLVNLTKQIRQAIINGNFRSLKKKWLL